MKKQKLRPAQPSKDQINASREITLRWIQAIEKIGTCLIVAGGVVAFAYVGIYLPIEASAGQETSINYAVKFLADLKVDVVLAWGTAASASVWAWRERQSKMKERAARDKRITELERRVDEKRTSSGLDVTGDRVLEQKK